MNLTAVTITAIICITIIIIEAISVAGKKKDSKYIRPENLIAMSREEHEKEHNGYQPKRNIEIEIPPKGGSSVEKR